MLPCLPCGIVLSRMHLGFGHSINRNEVPRRRIYQGGSDGYEIECGSGDTAFVVGSVGLAAPDGVALGVFGMYLLQPYPGGTGTAKSTPPSTAGVIDAAPGQDMLSVEWLEQQRAMRTPASAVARPQDDVLSVEWLEQNRAINSNKTNAGSRSAQPLPDNYIGLIE